MQPGCAQEAHGAHPRVAVRLFGCARVFWLLFRCQFLCRHSSLQEVEACCATCLWLLSFSTSSNGLLAGDQGGPDECKKGALTLCKGLGLRNLGAVTFSGGLKRYWCKVSAAQGQFYRADFSGRVFFLFVLVLLVFLVMTMRHHCLVNAKQNCSAQALMVSALSSRCA